MPRELAAWITPEIMILSYLRLTISGRQIVFPTAMPATLRPLIAAMMAISTMVPMARPPRTGPIQTYSIWYRSSAIPDLENMYPM